MKKFFSLLALCAMVMVSCESWFSDDTPKKPSNTETPGDGPNDDPIDTPVAPEIEFQLTSEGVVEFSADGGAMVITYAITNPDEALNVDVAIDASWISLTDALDATPNSIALYVEANKSLEPRSAKVEVTYGEFVANVLVKQAADERLLPNLSGIYYDDAYGNDYNYTVVLSTAENVFDIVTGDYDPIEGNKYLFLDLYSSVPSSGYNVKFSIPEGVYLFDADNTSVAGTVGAEYTYFYEATADGEKVYFSSGEVTVEKGLIEAEFVDAEGNKYHYYSLVTEVDNTALFKGVGSLCELSTLAKDLEISFESPSLYAECYKDYYVVGKDMWVFYIDDYVTGHSIVMELLVPMGEAPVGLFPVSNDLTKERIALPGFADGNGSTWWSWYYLYDGYDVVDRAPIVSGCLEIVDDGTGTHTASFEFKEDKDLTISGSCTAYFETAGDIGLLAAKRRIVPSRK